MLASSPPANPSADPPSNLSRFAPSRRTALLLMLAVVTAWAVWQGAHEHAPATTTDLSNLQPTRSIVIDASTGLLDLSNVNVAPGEVVDLLLDGTAGSAHQFVLSGAPAAEMDVLTAPDGDTIIRLRVPEDGEVSFLCTIPGHEDLHGNLLVNIDD